jgi:hypothetical protein
MFFYDDSWIFYCIKLKKKIKEDFNREFSREEILNSIDLAIRRGAETEKEVLKEAINFLFS